MVASSWPGARLFFEFENPLEWPDATSDLHIQKGINKPRRAPNGGLTGANEVYGILVLSENAFMRNFENALGAQDTVVLIVGKIGASESVQLGHDVTLRIGYVLCIPSPLFTEYGKRSVVCNLKSVVRTNEERKPKQRTQLVRRYG